MVLASTVKILIFTVDVEAGDQYAARVEDLQSLGALRPAEGREWPQGRREPGIEHVRILLEREAGFEPILFPHLVFAAAHVDATVRVVPGGDAMSPPELSADTPVLDIPHPFEIGFRPVFRHEANATVLHRLDRRRRQRSGFNEPLIGQERLDDRMGSITAGDFHAVIENQVSSTSGSCSSARLASSPYFSRTSCSLRPT